MKKFTIMKNPLTVLILLAMLRNSLGETISGNERNLARNKSIENGYPFLAQDSFLEKKNREKSTRMPFSEREFYRRNYHKRSESEKRFLEKEKRGEEEYMRKVNRDALISKSEERFFRKEENFDSFNRKMLNNGQNIEEKEKTVSRSAFRNDDSYAPNRYPVLEGSEDHLSTNRQKKMKKHSSPSFIPFPSPRERKPNIILILTDDQDVELGSLNFMPKTLRLLRDGGAEFRHAYVTTPMCCPSRSSLLTGMYVHNHNVFTNNENCSNIQWQQTHETRTFATYLSNAGYRTGYFGKYLNKYNGSYIPPGWREWGGLIMNSRYYNYSINLNGKKIKHGFNYHKDYYPDLIANDSIAFLRQSKQYFSRKPVMLVLSFPAPHGPEDSAPQYSEMFFNVTTHHTPSYDYAPNPDKQWILQVTNKMQDIHKHFTNVLMTKRLQTLQSVDSAVERIYQELKNIGELDNTYILYTSDHGYHLGQFGLVKGKSFPFEFDVRVPFLVRGPGIEPGTVIDDIVLNIDLAPTFLDLAGVEAPLHMDGRSIVRLFHHRPTKRRRLRWPDTFLIESSGRREIPDSNSEAKKLKQEKLKLKEARLLKSKGITIEDVGFTQTFDTKTGSPDSSEAEVDEMEEEENFEEDNRSTSFAQNLPFREITKNSYVQVDNKIPQIVPPLTHPNPKLARLALECQSPDLQTPCQPGQKWHCTSDGDRWRKYKCKFQNKCTCFTPTGFVYTLPMKKDKGMLVSRKKRSRDIWAQVSENVDQIVLSALLSRSSKLMSRKKRDTAEDHITDVLDDLEQELIEAEETKSSINATFTLSQESNATICSVTSEGKVNCSSLVYNDFKIWKKSRDEIETKIQRLKAELEALKGIRKHLREKRPKILTPFIETLSSTTSTTTTTTTEATATEPKSETYNESYTAETETETVGQTDLSVFTDGSVDTTSSPHSEETDFTFSTFGLEVTTPKSPNNDLLFKYKQPQVKENENGFLNKFPKITRFHQGRDRCICRPDNQDLFTKKEEKELAKEARRKLKEERLRKKERKMKKKAKLEKECLSEKMNCFIHDNDHWKTPPLWTEGPFCFCMNANNNTYSCLRTINVTHNFLYCEFTTGFKTFYNLRIDPFEQLNRISTLTPDESRFLSNQLSDMKGCKGTKDCTTGSGRENFGFHHQHHQHHNYPARLKSDLNYKR